MAWSHVVSGSKGFDASGTTEAVNAGTGSHRLLVVGINTNNDGGASSVTYNGVGLTRAVFRDGTDFDVDVYYLVDPAAGSNTLSVTMASGTPDTGVAWQVWQAGNTPTYDKTASSAAGAVSVNITTAQANSLILGFWGDVDDAANARTPVSGVTERVDALAGAGAGDHGQWSGSRVEASAGTYAMGYTPDPGDAGGVAIAFYEPPVVVAPTVTTSAASSIDVTTATGNGNVTSDGGGTITERGFCWATTANPTTSSSKVVVAGTTGSYSGSMTGLSGSTEYHYRAYAINSAGTSYGADTTFTTLAANVAPTIALNTGTVTVGRETTGASSYLLAGGGADNYLLRKFTFTSEVTIARLSGAIYEDSGANATLRAVILSDPLDSNLYGDELYVSSYRGAANTTATFEDFTFTSTATLAAGTYWIGFQGQYAGTGSVYVAYDTGGATNETAIRTGDVNPAPAYTSYDASIHVDYAETTAFTTSTPTLEFTGSDTDDDDLRYNVQIATGTPIDEGATIDSYSETNQSTTVGVGTGNKKVAQSFTGDGQTLAKVALYLSNTFGITGNATVSIFAHSGTFGTSSVGTGSALATSDSFDVSAITSSLGLHDFIFSGANQITLTNGTRYVLAIEFSAVSAINVGFDNTSPTHDGNWSYHDGSSWQLDSATALDMCFYVYSAGNVVLSKLSGTDSGFTNTVNGADTDPFNAGEKISYTVQAGDALADGTYYWRARVTDPTGTNTYSSWSETRSFTITTGTAHTKELTDTVTASDSITSILSYFKSLTDSFSLSEVFSKIYTANTTPSVSPNTIDAHEFNVDLPTLEFTGTDTEGNEIRYQIQISKETF